MSSIYDWSRTAADNATADGAINWAEFMAPDQVNDSARQLMARIAEYFSDANPTRTSSGASNTYTIGISSSPSALIDGLTVGFIAHQANTSSSTLAVNSFGAIPLRSVSATSLQRGEVQTGQPVIASYRLSTNEWLIQNGAPQLYALYSTLLASNTFGLKIGDVKLSLAASPDAGFVRLTDSVQNLLKTDYPDLNTWASGQSYPWGSTSTTFGIPGAGGYFLRFGSSGSSIDPGGPRTPGTTQADVFKTHTHTGSTNTASHNHALAKATGGGGSTRLGASSRLADQQTGGSSGDNYTLLQGTTGSDVGVTGDASLTLSFTTAATGDTSETRPKNITMYADMLASPALVASGLIGAAGFAYRYATTTSGDPGSGYFSLNNATIGSATAVSISKTASNGADLSGVLALLPSGTTLFIAKTGAPSNYQYLTLASTATDHTTYVTFTLSSAVAGGTWASADQTGVLASGSGGGGGGGGGSGTVTAVDITAPAAGLTASGGPITSSGSITLSLANDLAALEALSGTNTIYYRSGADTWTAVAIGSGLTFSAGTLAVTGISGVATDTIWSAKGDIAAGTGSHTAAITSLGTNGQVLTADSTQTNGVKWANPAGGGDALTTSTLAQFAATTSAQLAGVISDETGSAGGGVLVFNKSPSLTTPAIGSGGATFAGSSSGTTTLAAAATASGTVTLPAATDTLVGKATTDTLTNKTLTSPTINGGTATGLTGLAVRNAGTGAFDLTLAANETLAAGRTLTLKLNDAARTLTVSGDATLAGANSGDQTVTLTGDVTGSGTSSFAATIAANAVTNAKMATMATATFKGNTSGSTAAPSDVSAANVTAALSAFTGDSGSGGTKGLVPAPGAGDAAAGKFLKADGTWSTTGTTGTQKSALFQFQATNGTAGGTATAGSRATYPLSTFVNSGAGNVIAGVVLSTNTFSGLPVDSYRADAAAEFNSVDGVQLWLRNVTQSSDVLIGTVVNAPNGQRALATLTGPFSVTNTNDVYALQYRVETTQASSGLGVASGYSDGVEVYGYVNIQALSAPTAAGTGVGGSTTQVQYNSSGALAGSANMTFAGSTLTIGAAGAALGAVAFAGNTSGTTTLNAAAAASGTLTLPAATDTLVGKATTDTLTNKTLTSPTLVTPALGTPASGTLTNATGLPIATGVSGLGTGVATFLATPSSANLAAALTDETGTGAAVFGTDPTFGGLIKLSAADALTAHAGGGQGSALALTSQVNRISTVATAADSVKLPASVAGMKIVVVNGAASNAMQVFGAGTDTINDVATATGVSQAAGITTTYSCPVAAKWYATALTSSGGGSSNGQFQSQQIFTASGTYTKPAGLVRAEIWVIAGGGGGGQQASGNARCGAGGGGGGLAYRVVAGASIGATETVTIGAGGTGGTDAAGSAGGTSSFGSWASATGGSGGSATNNTDGGAGGAGSSGDINITGQRGGSCTTVTNALPCCGGSSPMGYGLGATPPTYVAANGNGAGASGSGYGAGGSGAQRGSTGTTGGKGGDGTAGIIIVKEYF